MSREILYRLTRTKKIYRGGTGFTKGKAGMMLSVQFQADKKLQRQAEQYEAQHTRYRTVMILWSYDWGYDPTARI